MTLDLPQTDKTYLENRAFPTWFVERFFPELARSDDMLQEAHIASFRKGRALKAGVLPTSQFKFAIRRQLHLAQAKEAALPDVVYRWLQRVQRSVEKHLAQTNAVPSIEDLDADLGFSRLENDTISGEVALLLRDFPNRIHMALDAIEREANEGKEHPHFLFSELLSDPILQKRLPELVEALSPLEREVVEGLLGMNGVEKDCHDLAEEKGCQPQNIYAARHCAAEKLEILLIKRADAETKLMRKVEECVGKMKLNQVKLRIFAWKTLLKHSEKPDDEILDEFTQGLKKLLKKKEKRDELR